MTQRSERSSEVTVQISLRTITTLVLTGLGLWALWQIREFLILFLASSVVAMALSPVVRPLERAGFPRWLAIATIYLLMVAVLLTVLLLILPQAFIQLNQLAVHLQSGTTLPGGMKIQLPQGGNWWSLLTDTAKTSNPGETAGRLLSFASGFINGIVSLLTFFVLTFYLLLEGRKLARYILSFVPDSDMRSELGDVFVAASERMGYWFRGQSVVAITTFVVLYIGFLLMGVPYALSLALIAGLAEFVPLFGSWIGGVPAVVVAFSISAPVAVTTAVFILIWQAIQGHILVPQIMRRVLGIPSVLVFISVLILARLIGVIGVFLATPIAAAMTVVGRYYAERMHTRVRERLSGVRPSASSDILQKRKG